MLNLNIIPTGCKSKHNFSSCAIPLPSASIPISSVSVTASNFIPALIPTQTVTLSSISLLSTPTSSSSTSSTSSKTVSNSCNNSTEPSTCSVDFMHEINNIDIINSQYISNPPMTMTSTLSTSSSVAFTQDTTSMQSFMYGPMQIGRPITSVASTACQRQRQQHRYIPDADVCQQQYKRQMKIQLHEKYEQYFQIHTYYQQLHRSQQKQQQPQYLQTKLLMSGGGFCYVPKSEQHIYDIAPKIVLTEQQEQKQQQNQRITLGYLIDQGPQEHQQHSQSIRQNPDRSTLTDLVLEKPQASISTIMNQKMFKSSYAGSQFQHQNQQQTLPLLQQKQYVVSNISKQKCNKSTTLESSEQYVQYQQRHHTQQEEQTVTCTKASNTKKTSQIVQALPTTMFAIAAGTATSCAVDNKLLSAQNSNVFTAPIVDLSNFSINCMPIESANANANANASTTIASIEKSNYYEKQKSILCCSPYQYHMRRCHQQV